ncbi:transcriptional regulator [Streptomyces sp. H39-S7]|uniref:transcriptional regulator n=1 Tax=Streptomyces sp. H39-S7 TaxID=3004357 RepID=UPI0022AE93ED|nr:transcriptional regulator [Streptomyces sp. H39-S7]MCZ4122671.1 transcriptional regulator [Streptomyces sp. H39-S7]
MPATTGGIPACPLATDRQRRLALQLTDMIPGAVRIRVSLQDPQRAWPQPHARAWDVAGTRIELSRTVAKIAARWVLRVWPDADWNVAHTMDLTTATLTTAAWGR